MKYYTEWIEQARIMYEQGMKYYQIANILGVDRKVVSYRLRQLGYQSDQRYVRTVPIEKLRHYDYSSAEKVFETIDTEEKAYWLGFLYADGNVDADQNTISLALSEEDKSHVKRFRTFMSLCDKKLHKKYKKKDNKTYVSYEFSFTSQIIKEQLVRLGCRPKKTYTLQFPTPDMVPDELINHFFYLRDVMESNR